MWDTVGMEPEEVWGLSQGQLAVRCHRGSLGMVLALRRHCLWKACSRYKRDGDRD